jgi:hypothetical protein
VSTSRLTATLSALGVLVWSGAADGQPGAQARLANAKSLTCAFSLLATGTWQGGEPKSETKPAKLSLGFDAIEVDDGTARVKGVFGPSDIIVKLSLGTLHFVQSFREGPLYVTTVFPKETRNGKLQAVHTRHEYTEVILLGFTSRPEQYYGECSVEP